MNCNVVKDLIPLYLDDCCSEDSAKVVAEHLEHCRDCKEYCDDMREFPRVEPAEPAPQAFGRINEWKASLMQSAALFAAFALITAGVALEAATPLGRMNGFWAMSLVVPATGFMLSLANWFFVRLYPSRKLFSACSLLANLVFTGGACVWALLHYEWKMDHLQGIGLAELGIGVALTAVLSVLAGILSGRYAAMLGKE